MENNFHRYQVNENFFESVNSEEVAYTLGFFYADGNNQLNKVSSSKVLSLTQAEQDLDILQKIKDAMKSTHPLKRIEAIDEKHIVKYKLSIAYAKLSDDAYKLGVVYNKSLVLTFPTFDIVPEKYMNHFIRGYFDGDGCVWDGKPKIMTFIDKKTGKEKKRFIHNVKFNFTGSTAFITELQEYLIKTLKFRKTKLNVRKSRANSDKWCTMEYSGKGQLETLFHYMYDNATIYGNRKFNKFVEILSADSKKLRSEAWLNAETPETVTSSEALKQENRSSTIPEMGVDSSESKCQTPNNSVEGGDIVSSAVN